MDRPLSSRLSLPFRFVASVPARIRWHIAMRRWANGDFGDSPRLDVMFREAEKIVRLGFCNYNPPGGYCFVHGQEGCA